MPLENNTNRSKVCQTKNLSFWPNIEIFIQIKWKNQYKLTIVGQCLNFCLRFFIFFFPPNCEPRWEFHFLLKMFFVKETSSSCVTTKDHLPCTSMCSEAHLANDSVKRRLHELNCNALIWLNVYWFRISWLFWCAETKKRSTKNVNPPFLTLNLCLIQFAIKVKYFRPWWNQSKLFRFRFLSPFFFRKIRMTKAEVVNVDVIWLY